MGFFDGPQHIQTPLIFDSVNNAFRTLSDSDFGGGGQVSTGNSTNTALGAGAAWTGQTQDVSSFSSVVIAVKTDQDGLISMQFSPDGVNWDSQLSYEVNSGVNEVHRLTTTRQYYRTKFQNNGLDQTYMRLQTILGEHTQLNAPRNGMVQKDADAYIVRSTDPLLELAQGRIQGEVAWEKFGYNEGLNADIEETVWATGGRWVPLTTGSNLTIRSNSNVDSAWGSGAIGIRVQGVTSGCVEKEAYYQLSGTTGFKVPDWLGINRVIITGAGAYKRNFGAIELIDDNNNVQAFIPAGEGTTQQCIFFVPSGYYGYGKKLLVNVSRLAGGQAPRIVSRVYVYNFDSNVQQEVITFNIDTSIDNFIDFVEGSYFILPPKTTIELTATSSLDAAFTAGRFWITNVKQ